jgi:hypothetical protein
MKNIMRFVTIRVCEWIDIHLSFFAPIRACRAVVPRLRDEGWEIRGQLSFSVCDLSS